MPIEMGRRHGNSYTNSTYKKIIFTFNSSECTSPKIMQARIDNKLVLSQCPATCEFFEECVAKSGEVRE